jgi:hypothetical protein
MRNDIKVPVHINFPGRTVREGYSRSHEKVMEDEEGLFNIEISFSDEATVPPKPLRDHQSQENFRQQKASWKPKIENGEVVFPFRFGLKHL